MSPWVRWQAKITGPKGANLLSFWGLDVTPICSYIWAYEQDAF